MVSAFDIERQRLVTYVKRALLINRPTGNPSSRVALARGKIESKLVSGYKPQNQ